MIRVHNAPADKSGAKSPRQNSGEPIILPQYTVPDRPWRGLRLRRRRSNNLLPPLQSFDLELNVFRALLRDPARHLILSRHFTLTKNRWLAAARVVKTLLRDGHSAQTAEWVLTQTILEFATADFEYISSIAETVQFEMRARQSWLHRTLNHSWSQGSEHSK